MQNFYSSHIGSREISYKTSPYCFWDTLYLCSLLLSDKINQLLTYWTRVHGYIVVDIVWNTVWVSQKGDLLATGDCTDAQSNSNFAEPEKWSFTKFPS